MRKLVAPAAAALVLLAAGGATSSRSTVAATTTPIQHLVVIYGENVSFDHYFGTYPEAKNPIGEPRFVPASGTPSVNGLTPQLLTDNPNGTNPARLDRADLFPCDQLHEYPLEQRAADGGAMDKFVPFTGNPKCGNGQQVMDYYDGNTVTALWNYAQHYALSDAFFGSTYGPSTPGALNLVAGQTHGATPATIPEMVSNGTVIGDADPGHDDCASQPEVTMSGRNVGDLLNANRVTWGWFQGGFHPTTRTNGVATCGSSHTDLQGDNVKDYVPHHDPFQYYASTANPHHLPPSSPQSVGRTDQANHQYGLDGFLAALARNDLPAVSFLKAAAYQDAHPGNSSPLDEQTFLVRTINAIEQSPAWPTTAIVIAYDDSDGWYDHVFGPNLQHSADPPYDGLYGTGGSGLCGTPGPAEYQDRCGLGPRLPLLVLSPYARTNYVSHVVLEQASILRFIEDNWSLGRLGDQSFDARAASLADLFNFSRAPATKPYLLDPATGQPPAR
jgi:phospholipase C